MKQLIMPLILLTVWGGALSCKPSVQNKRTYGSGTFDENKANQNGGDATGTKAGQPATTPTQQAEVPPQTQTPPQPAVTGSPAAVTPATPPTAAPTQPKETLKVVHTYVGGQFKLVDIAIAFDGSGSMFDKIPKLQQNLHVFVTELAKKGLDAQIVVLAEKFEIPQDLAGVVTHIARPVGSHESIRYLKEFYTSIKRVRPNSSLEAIAITDDDAAGQGQLAADFATTYYDNRRIRFNGVIETDRRDQNNNVLPSPCKGIKYGAQYDILKKSTGGVIVDICQEDWSILINQIVNNILKLNQSYPLTDTPDESAAISVSIDGKAIPQTEFTVKAADKTIIINNPALLGENAKVEIVYYKKQ
jgi:hypothetical protein